MAEEKLLTQTTKTSSTTTELEADKKPRAYSSVLATVGFIILIVIVLWGLYHIASLASPFFSSLFKTNTPAAIQVTAPSTVKSKESFMVHWKYSPRENGAYALLYQCNDNFHFESLQAAGAMNSVPCGVAFGIPATNNAENTLALTPVLSGNASTTIPFSILFMPSATSSKQAQGIASIVVIPSVVTPPVETVKPVTPKPTVYTSPADLSVQILGVSVDPSGMGVVEFDIGNQGGRASGSYYFEAFLPTQSTYTYNSPLQSSLGAGDHIVNTIRFSEAVPGTISIVVDPTNSVSESNENNNYVTQSMYNYIPGSYPYQQQYSQPYQYPYVY